MKKIRIVDVTLRENASRTDIAMSFREKLEVAKQMDKLKVDAVELPPLGDSPSDGLLIRSIAGTLENAVVSCPAGLTAEDLPAESVTDTGRFSPADRFQEIYDRLY